MVVSASPPQDILVDRHDLRRGRIAHQAAPVVGACSPTAKHAGSDENLRRSEQNPSHLDDDLGSNPPTLAERVGQRSSHLAWARLGELIENAGACAPG